MQGQTHIAVWNAQLKLYGLISSNATNTDDGTATFATDIDPSLLVGVALHELTHALGRVPYGPPYASQPDTFDLFRFASAGNQVINGASTASAAYFSVDGGYTKIADYGRTSDPSDFLNSGVQGGNDPFNEFYNYSTLQSLTTIDKEQLDALGFHLASPLTTTIQTDTNTIASTSLVGFFGNYYLENAASGVGPELKLGGAPVVAGQFAPYTPIGAAQTASGYEIALENAATNQFSIWNTDSNGNFLSSAAYSGSSTALESLEISFNQDLNGDGVIGIPVPVVISAFGSTSLVQLGSHYVLDSISSGTGPVLERGGAPVVTGQFGAWVPIGAQQTSSGFDVAWRIPGTDQYTVWNTDSSGNYISNIIGVVSGSSAALESLEPIFHQDLNGDGTIGVVSKVMSAFGSTELAEVGNNYFLDSISGGTGPELERGGAPVVDGQFGGWVPIGAQQTSNGFDVAWRIPGTDQYTVWNTDSSGNYISNIIGVVSGSSAALESLEPIFHQDLNGDGTIGLVGTVIEASGSTELVEVGNNYVLAGIGSGTGPELERGGAPVVTGQFGAWVPIGAEQTASGYDVAWRIPGTDQYTVWNTDSSGNYISNIIGVVSGSSTALESLETTFHQDLNGDGTIGLVSTVIEASGSTKLVEVGNNYFLDGIGSGTSPELERGGAPVVTGQFGAWVPIGAEQTASGYDVAWRIPGTDQYTVWNTDSNGNYISNIIGVVSGSSAALESLETTFHQDLNGDGTIGVPAATSSGTSALATLGAAVTVVSNDTFVFRPGIGAEVIANATGADTIELDGFSSVTSNAQLAAFLSEAQAGQPQAMFQQTNGGHDTLINLANHDSITLTNVHIADLIASHFIIH